MICQPLGIAPAWVGFLPKFPEPVVYLLFTGLMPHALASRGMVFVEQPVST